MELLNQLAGLIAGLLGLSVEQTVVLVFGAAVAPVTVWVTNKLKSLFTSASWFPGEMADKISGAVMVFVSALIAVVVVIVTGWVFGVNYLGDASLFEGVVGALGVNQTVAQFIYHKVKAKQ